MIRTLALSVLVTCFLSACKIIQIVPEGGSIVSRTGENNCPELTECEIDVPNGDVFSDTFTAEPKLGYEFVGWKQADRFLCGGVSGSCALENVPGSFTDQDIDLFLEPVFLALPNEAPIAEAGEDQSVEAGALVTLDGVGSNDADGEIVEYLWAQTDGPEVTLETLENSSVQFQAPSSLEPATLVFLLTVTDNLGAVGTDTISIAVGTANLPPTADIVGDDSISSFQSLVLDGGTSMDTDGIISAYSWDQIEGPMLDLGDTSAAELSLDIPEVAEETTVTIELTVTDDLGAIASTTFTFTIFPPDTARILGSLTGVTVTNEFQTETTGDSGEFAFVDNTLHEFSIGNLLIGTVTVQGDISLADLVKNAIDIAHPDVQWVIQLLTTLDDDCDASNGYQFNELTSASLTEETDILGLERSDSDAQVMSLLSSSACTESLVDATDAITQYQDSVAAELAPLLASITGLQANGEPAPRLWQGSNGEFITLMPGDEETGESYFLIYGSETNGYLTIAFDLFGLPSAIYFADGSVLLLSNHSGDAVNTGLILTDGTVTDVQSVALAEDVLTIFPFIYNPEGNTLFTLGSEESVWAGLQSRAAFALRYLSFIYQAVDRENTSDNLDELLNLTTSDIATALWYDNSDFIALSSTEGSNESTQDETINSALELPVSANGDLILVAQEEIEELPIINYAPTAYITSPRNYSVAECGKLELSGYGLDGNGAASHYWLDNLGQQLEGDTISLSDLGRGLQTFTLVVPDVVPAGGEALPDATSSVTINVFENVAPIIDINVFQDISEEDPFEFLSTDYIFEVDVLNSEEFPSELVSPNFNWRIDYSGGGFLGPADLGSSLRTISAFLWPMTTNYINEHVISVTAVNNCDDPQMSGSDTLVLELEREFGLFPERTVNVETWLNFIDLNNPWTFYDAFLIGNEIIESGEVAFTVPAVPIEDYENPGFVYGVLEIITSGGVEVTVTSEDPNFSGNSDDNKYIITSPGELQINYEDFLLSRTNGEQVPELFVYVRNLSDEEVIQASNINLSLYQRINLVDFTATSVITYNQCPAVQGGYSFTFTESTMVLTGSDTWDRDDCTLAGPDTYVLDAAEIPGINVPFNCVNYPICELSDLNKVVELQDRTNTYSFDLETLTLTVTVVSGDGIFTEVVSLEAK